MKFASYLVDLVMEDFNKSKFCAGMRQLNLFKMQDLRNLISQNKHNTSDHK